MELIDKISKQMKLDEQSEKTILDYRFIINDS
ncbi:hypothetical protein [Candidatus Atelocyanobacterium thalassae]|jgi:hypothetical protein|uniref:KaiA C-terminal domain-containing protein n=1 Tax=Atelocyanobacterium thalassa (isolate ALOHA) TaxID=1453429 RepID=D3EPP9_ATETH|nr:hypothetical protein UCYN_07550 [Candidatus Atelocyanobacterium thalassa isolate ALOHA]